MLLQAVWATPVQMRTIVAWVEGKPARPFSPGNYDKAGNGISVVSVLQEGICNVTAFQG